MILYSMYNFEKVSGDLKFSATYKLTYRSGENTEMDDLLPEEVTAKIIRGPKKYRTSKSFQYSFELYSNGKLIFKSVLLYSRDDRYAVIAFFKRFVRQTFLRVNDNNFQMFVYGMKTPGPHILFNPTRKKPPLVEKVLDRIMRNDPSLLHEMDQLMLDATKL